MPLWVSLVAWSTNRRWVFYDMSINNGETFVTQADFGNLEQVATKAIKEKQKFEIGNDQGTIVKDVPLQQVQGQVYQRQDPRRYFYYCVQMWSVD